jgi:titin
MEDDTTQKKVLETHPQWISTGWIQGAYYNVKVPSGATLNVKAGFLKGATGSNGVLYSVRFQEKGTSTWYYFPNGTTTYNAGHAKTYSENMWTLSWFLQDLAGKTGEFDLRVDANGDSGQDWACWLQADITALTVPGAVEAHSSGTSVTVDWDYTYTAPLFRSLSFEVQRQISVLPAIWFGVGTVAYPATTLTLEDQSAGLNTYRVRAVETITFIGTTTIPSDGSSPVSSWVLSAPTGADVQRVANGMGIKVKWTGLDPVATHYQVLRTTNPLMRAPVIHEGPHTDTSWVDEDVDPNKKYYYYLRAVKTGTESEDKDISSQSSAGSITTPPEAPTSQVAQSSGRTITVSWAHSGNCSQFHVWSKPTSVTDPVMPAMLPSTQRSYTITDAEYGKWMVDMAAWGEGGYSPDTPVLDVWVLTTPSAPLAVVGGATTVNLTWGTPDANATTVRILRSVSAGPFASLSTVASGVTSFADTTCLAGTMYAYKLQAVRGDDVSELSPASTSVTTSAALAAPATPTGLTATGQSPMAVGLTWTDNADNETSYHVFRRDGAALAFVQVSPDLPAGTMSWQDTSVAASSLYTYTVKAHNAAGDSGSSNEASVTTPAAPAAPATPTGLAAVAQSSTAVGLTWTDNASNETSYRVFRRDGAAPAAVQVSLDLPAGTVSWQDNGLTASSLYTYTVKAHNAAGDSGSSNEASVTTPAAPVPVPATPTGLVATAGSSTVVNLTWEDNASNEDSYRAYRKEGTATSFVQVSPDLPAGTTRWQDTSVAPSSTYTYAVKARNPSGDSGWSNEASVTTPSAVQSVIMKLIIDKKNYTINGVSMMMDVAPVILESRTLGPVRYVAEALGADVAWDPVERKVTLTQGGKVIELWIGKNTARVDGAYMLIDPQNPEVKPVILPPGRTMLPFRFIAEQLGAGVEWDAVKREVTITYPAS